MSPKVITGIILILIAILITGLWIILLNVGKPAYVTWENNFNNLLSEENGMRPWFYASIGSVITSCIMAVIYFSKASNSSNVLLFLLLISIMQAVVAILYLSWDFKILYSLPILFGYLSYKKLNREI